MKTSNSARQVLLLADRSVPYGKVAKVVAAIREAGVLDLGLVTKAMDVRSPGRRSSRNSKSGPKDK